VMEAPCYDEQGADSREHRVALTNHERESMDQYGDDLGRRVRTLSRRL
jgi:hypothetical protein